MKTESIAKVLDRSPIAVWQTCKTNGFKLQERTYSAEPIQTIFNGKFVQLTAFKYTRNEKGYIVDKTIIRKSIGRPRKHPKKEEKQPMAAHRRKPELKPKKANNKEQESAVKGFNPEGKKLVKIDNKTWKYV